MDKAEREYDYKISLESSEFSVSMLERGEEHDKPWRCLGWAIHTILGMASPFIVRHELSLALAVRETIEEGQSISDAEVDAARTAFHDAACNLIDAHDKWVAKLSNKAIKEVE